MELKKFKLVSLRPALWAGKEVPTGATVAIIATETEGEARWFFSKINFTAWDLVAVDATPAPVELKGKVK